jgi:phosphatidylinositol-3-phosphatase
VRSGLTASIVTAAALLASCGASATHSQTREAAVSSIKPCGTATAPPPARYDHVVWIVMENKSYSDVMGSKSAAFTRSLAAACGSAANFRAEAHPSLPNYIAMTSGSTHGVRDDRGPGSHPLPGPSIFSQLGGHWRALQESMPSRCYRGNSLLYAVRHNPAAYYTGLARSCARHDVRLSSPPDVSARFTFIPPNLCHDTHNCGVGTGDRFLSSLLTDIASGAEYRAGKTAVFITYDEDDGSHSNRIPTLVISPYTRPGTRSSKRFTHYSLLRTTEDMLGLKRLGAAAHAPSMRKAFGL